MKRGRKEKDVPTSSKKESNEQRSTKRHVFLSVGDILSDELTELSLKHWAGDNPEPFDLKLVADIYTKHISNGDLRSVQLLEMSKYLEAYLWPNVVQGCKSREFLMSVVSMTNEKFRERATVFDFLTSGAEAAERITKFFEAITDSEWLVQQALSVSEETAFVRFLVGCFENLSHELLRRELVRLVHLPLWDNLSSSKLNIELSVAPKSIQKQWRVFCNQKKKGKSFKRETSFLPYLFDVFFVYLSGSKKGEKDSDLFLQRFLELSVDLLAQLPTRRYFKLFVEDSLLLPRLLLQSDLESSRPATFKLVQMFRFYLEFEVDEFSGEALLEEDVARRHAERIHRLQERAFEMTSGESDERDLLRRFSISNVGSMGSRQTLSQTLSRLSDEAITNLADAVGISAAKLLPGENARQLLSEALLVYCQLRTSQLEYINRISLYPTEALLWDESLIPSDNYNGNAPLPLPKLSLQYLTFYDYLLRNYNLFRLEAAYEIKMDVENVISRIEPKRLNDGQIKFQGWARAALPLRSTKILHVAEPLLGTTKPSEVRMEVIFSLHHFNGDLRDEWDKLKQHDVVFLMIMDDPEHIQKKTHHGHNYGLRWLRGCEVLEVWDEQGNRIRSETQKRSGDIRRLVVQVDPAQYQTDVRDKNQSMYAEFNLLMIRDGAENTFKGILDTVRSLINTQDITIPPWLKEVFLGYGNPKNALPDPNKLVDYGDTFLDPNHVQECFPDAKVEFENGVSGPPPYKVSISEDHKSVRVTPYSKLDMGPFPEEVVRQNRVRFTQKQVLAIGSGAREGLTLVVGPPGTGKTDTAVQILSLLYRQNPHQRTLMLTHSNAALNQIFEKLIGLDIDPSQMVRLGHGEKHLDASESFGLEGRVNYLLARRIRLLADVERLAQSLGLATDAAYSCETAHHFFFQHIFARWEKFTRDASDGKNSENPGWVLRNFPFSTFFALAPRQPVFTGADFARDLESATACYRHLERLFKQLDECHALEVLRNVPERSGYVLVKHSRIVAMTVTFAALMRKTLVKQGFRFDNVVLEEAGQVKEIESFIPLLMQEQAHMEDRLRLKRVVLIGDDNQLPPVVKNAAFEKYSNLDQSLFARLIKLGVPHILLDCQGRTRPGMAQLFSWRYANLGNLPRVSQARFKIANPGFRWDYQLINVEGPGETCPRTHYFQNIAEAEFVVATFMYMRTLGYPANSITILTTYKGQKHLIRDVIKARCASLPKYGRPSKILTVDKYQGQQNDFVLLSMVRTQHVGHIRDVRRLIVSVSRACFGLYVFCRQSLFQNCYEVMPVFQHFLGRPTTLELVPKERYDLDSMTRTIDMEPEKVVSIPNIEAMGQFAASGFRFNE